MLKVTKQKALAEAQISKMYLHINFRIKLSADNSAAFGGYVYAS